MKVRLFPGGPEFPAEFLDAVQKGEVVFFCGAGLSVGTGLPLFPGLVRELDGILNPDPNDRFDKGRTDDDHKGRKGRTDYDRMLSELEDRFVPGRMRKHVRAILSKPPQDPKGILLSTEAVLENHPVLENHRNILNLAATPGGGGVRLVTTNFDDRFALANGGEIRSDDAPKMPVPESPEWSSLVHLHGRICEGGNLSDLVLTAADFGRAYLSEGWARHFVIRLMRRWPVAFVGYGLDDPPMRYLMDAVYDPRGNPEEFKQAFALVGCGADEEDEQRREWEGKRVVPILYDSADSYAALRQVLRELARLKDEPSYRAELAMRGTDGNPDDEDGDKGRRVVWALNNLVTAQTFAGKKFFPRTADGEKFVHWLDAFKKAKLFRTRETDKAAPTDTLDYPPRFSPLPPIAEHLADWAARHAHQPALLRWLAGQDASLHPALIRELHSRVFGRNKAGPAIPEELRELWGIFLQSHPVDSAGIELLGRQAYRRANLPPNAKLELEQRILSAMRPLPVIVPEGQSTHARQSAGGFGIRVKVGCGLTRFPGQGDFILGGLEEEKSARFALAHAEELSAYLERALSIMARHEMSTDDLACLLPETNRHWDYRENYWKFLARMVRNAVRKLVEAKKHRRLANLISQWAESEYPLLWRMALYAATEAAKHFPEFRDGGNWGAKILVEKCGAALWSGECRPECLRFLRRAGGAIASPELSELESAILSGPPKGFRVSSFDGSPQEAAVVRMAKLGRAARLSPESARMLADARAAEPEMEFENFMECRKRKWGEPKFPEMPKRVAPQWAEMAADECADHIQSAEWSDLVPLVKNHPDKAVESFEILAKREFWNREKWSLLLGGFEWDNDLQDGIAVRLVRLLEAMPDGLARDLVRDCAWLLQIISRARPFSDMEKIWRKMWRGGAEQEIQKKREDGTVRDAFMDPCGTLAEIVVIRLFEEKELAHLFGLLEEILGSAAPGHMFGRAVVGGCVGFLFRKDPEWTKKHVLPMFDEKHPDSLHAWVEFLNRLPMSADLAKALKPALIDAAKRADKFSDYYARPAFARLSFDVCSRFPMVFSDAQQRRLVGNMKEKTLEDLCKHLQFVLSDDDGAKREEIWRDSIGPFLKRVWPERRSIKTSKNSELLGDIVAQTGDAFPDAFQWAEDFLSPIAAGHAHPMHPVTSFLDSHQEQVLNIPDQFPQECLLFLNQIVPDEEFLHRNELGIVLDKIKAADLKLEKHPAYIRLREIASGG